LITVSKIRPEIYGSSKEKPMLKAANNNAAITIQRCFLRYDNSIFMFAAKIKKGNG
jgi:hypothetical protein